jgi:hypothetical protein
MGNIDLERAKDIIARFDLSENTLRVWKTRGAIPKKYIDGSAIKKEGKISPREMKRLTDVLFNPKINLKRFFESCETIKVSDIYDYEQIGTEIDKVQYLEIKKRLNKLRTEVKVLAGSKNFNTDLKKWIFLNPEFKISLLLDRKALFFKQGKIISVDEKYYRDRLQLFLLESTLI